MKTKLFFIFSLVFVQTYAQIAITEVYYDTPNSEFAGAGAYAQGAYYDKHHHRGEFIELYNYSDEDINLKGWYLRDHVSVYYFPDRIIKSGEFLVVAYGKPNNEDYFPYFFPTTAGKESQIIYQNKIMLRNAGEDITVGVNSFKGTRVGFSADEMGYRGERGGTFIKGIAQNPENRFYTVQSLALTASTDETYVKETPTPLQANYKPAIKRINEIPNVRNAFMSNYALLDWSGNVLALTQSLCGITIGKIQQMPSGAFNQGKKCVNYDTAGNLISAADCSTNPATTTDTSYNYDALEDIKNAIAIYPNPTRGEVTIKWSGTALNKINSLNVYNAGGQAVYNTSPKSGVSSVTFNLAGQLPGIFVANFTLNTNQVISKNILKIP